MNRANDKEIWCANQPRLLTFVVTGALLLVSVFAEYTMACCVTDVDLYVRKAPTDPWAESVTLCTDETVYFRAECQADADPDECRPIWWQFNFQDGYVTDLYTNSPTSGPCSGGTFSKYTSHAYYHGSDWEPSVTVERQGAGCVSLQDTCQVRAVEVEIEAFDRVPPTKTENVLVTVTPSLAGSGHTIELDVIRTAGTSGSATVSPSSITGTTTVTVTGGDQTSVGNADNLSLRAKLDGGCVCNSEAFTVCAHPKDGSFCVDRWSPPPPEFGDRYGMAVWYKWESDSDDVSHLDECWLSESSAGFGEDPPFYVGSITLGPARRMNEGELGDGVCILKSCVHDYTDGYLHWVQYLKWTCERCDQEEDVSTNGICFHVYEISAGDWRIVSVVVHSCPGPECVRTEDIVE